MLFNHDQQESCGAFVPRATRQASLDAATGREPGQNDLSSFLISFMHDDGGSQMPGAGRHRHKQTLDTGRQGANSPAQHTCGPPPALFAAQMPDRSM